MRRVPRRDWYGHNRPVKVNAEDDESTKGGRQGVQIPPMIDWFGDWSTTVQGQSVRQTSSATHRILLVRDWFVDWYYRYEGYSAQPITFALASSLCVLRTEQRPVTER